MTARSSAPAAWGVVYTGSVDLEVAANAVEAASIRMGMTCTRLPLGVAGVGIEAVQTKPWYRILLTALPQRIDWRLEPAGEELSIVADFRLRRWYAVFLAVLGVTVIGGLAAGVASASLDWPDEWRWLESLLQGLVRSMPR